MSYTLCQLLTNADGYLLGKGEIDYSQLPEHLINLGKFQVPYNLMVNFTHQALLKDFGKGEEIEQFEVLRYWQDTRDELIGAGSVDDYLVSMRSM